MGPVDAATTDEVDEETRARRAWDRLLHPEAIEEVSEPVSPASGPPSQPHSTGTSVLTEMLRNSPPEEQRAGTDKSTREPRPPAEQHRKGAVRPADEGESSTPADERTGLLASANGRKPQRSGAHGNQDLESQRRTFRRPWLRAGRLVPWLNRKSLAASARTVVNPRCWNARAIWQVGVVKPAGYVPAVILGLLLNILDGLSYGWAHNTIWIGNVHR